MGKNHEKGQVLLIVVLIMVVSLTVGLSIAARSITNLKIASDDENSQRAFSAAEAGVEKLVKSTCTTECTIGQQNFGNDATFQGKATPIQGGSFLLKGGIEIKQDEGIDVWLSDYSTDAALLYGNQKTGTVTIYWGDTTGECSNAALEIMVLSGNKSNPQMTRYAVDPCNTNNRRTLNHFSPPGGSGTVASQSFPYSYSVTVNNGLLMRITPLYTNAIIGISSNNISFPIQGHEIETTGNAGGTVRKITFIQGYSSIPAEFFQYTLIAPK